MKNLVSKKLVLTDEQEKQLRTARKKAVSEAWKRERTFVENGKGTRDWTKEQQEEILTKGKVAGFDGQHMRSVSYGKTFEERMEIASNKNNIEFLESTKENNEHLKAHGGNWRNVTNGYYDPKTGQTKDFGKGEPKMPTIKRLSNPVCQPKQDIKNEDNYNMDNNQKNNYSRGR